MLVTKNMRRIPTECTRKPSKEIVEESTDRHIHHEYFKPGEIPGTWEWWEKLNAGNTGDFILERTKTFTEESFVEEVLQPMVDHLGECTCEAVRFHALNGGYDLPTWLAWTPERAQKPLQRIHTDDPELNHIMYGNSCYQADDQCCYCRTRSRTDKIQLWVTIAENLKKQRDELLRRLNEQAMEFSLRRQEETRQMCTDVPLSMITASSK